MLPASGASTVTFQYFAPSFFSPFYFAPIASVASQPSGPTRYYAPTYFSRYYFPTLFASATPQAAEDGPFTDRGAYAAMAQALEGTGSFAVVTFGTTADRRPAGVDLTPAAVITPVWWDEIDDVDPYVIVRRVGFDLTIIVRDEDPVARFGQLDSLTGLAQDAIDGADLGGGCLPALTMLRRGSYDPNPVHPEQRVVLRGEFTYLIPSLNGHTATS
jgi:hypothetical protein